LKKETIMFVDPTKAASQYLTFRLGAEMFALDVSNVREVLDFTAITKVPRAPQFMRGVINVRGSVVPVVDLHIKFGMPVTERTVDTRIVVMEIELDGEITVIGALADAVQNVMEIDPAQIEKTPAIGTDWDRDLIKGIGKHDDRFIMILDVNRLFSTKELAKVQDKASASRDRVQDQTETDSARPDRHPAPEPVA
jgi:purine-binding chemotaxis protein CheW